jgi:Tol biopolymer transport system component
VTELLDGESLRRRLARGPLQPRKAVELATQIARGLCAAHARGIVHRDLKPENVFLTRDGHAKILDFGLAALRPPIGADDSSVTDLSTPGMVLGTAAYMSPEQARGDVVDPRSDIFSFGVVLYEMLSGHNPFERETNADTMAAILKEDPPELPDVGRRVSVALEGALRRCLEKRPEERFQSAADLAYVLEGAALAASSPSRAPVTSLSRTAWIGAGLLVGTALVAVALRPGPPAADRRQLPRVRTLTFSGSDRWPASSPDGRTIAFSSKRDGRGRIWIKDLGTGGEQPVTTGEDAMPQFSPDGSSLLFIRDEAGTGTLYRQALVGGEPRRLVRNVIEAAWAPDGRRIAFLRVASSDQGWKTAIGVADARDGSEHTLTDSPQRLYGVGWSSDGTRISVIETVPRGIAPEFWLLLVDAASGRVERRSIQHTRTAVSPAVWNGVGHDLVFARAGSLVGDQGNPLSQVVSYEVSTGRERTLFYAEHLFPSMGGSARPAHLDIVSGGTVVFSSATVREYLSEFGTAPGSRSSGAVPLTHGSSRDRQPTYSPDGRRILFTSNRGGNLDLWMADVATGSLRQITDDAAEDWDPAFSPDGERIVWSSDRGGHLEVWSAAADGSGAQQVTQDGLDAENPSMTPDGRWIVYWSSRPENRGLWKIHPDGTGAARIVSGQYALPEVSPDGRWISYLVLEPNNLRNVIRVVAFEDGRTLPFEILVPAPFNRPEDVILGRHRWLPDGKGIVFVGCDERGRADLFVQTFDPGVDLGTLRRTLYGPVHDLDIESFDISPDGRHLTASLLDASRQLMIAEAVPGIARP